MPEADPQECLYPVDLKDFVRAQERAELVGDADSEMLHREQARLAAGRKERRRRRDEEEDELPEE